ncbi:MAG: hypothetical protein WCB70_02440 [Xanthobacteraceae bacterium]
MDACFVATDSTGQKLTYVYFAGEPGRRTAAKLLTRDEARRIAAKQRGCLSWRCLLQGPPMHALIVGYVPEFGFATHRRLDLLYFSHASKLA